MGTSKSYGGPRDRPQMLPADAPPPPGSADNPADLQAPAGAQPILPPLPATEPTTWQATKGVMSRLSSSGVRGAAAKGRVRDISSRYVRASGGAGKAARGAVAGRRAAQNLGGFLAAAVSSGFSAAADALGISDALGQPAEYLLEALVGVLAPNGDTLEEAVARVAMNKALDELIAEYSTTDGDLAALENLSPSSLRDVLEAYLTHYINTRLMQALSDRNEENSSDAATAVALERDIKQYVRETVQVDLHSLEATVGDVTSLDWSGTAGRDFVERIFRDGFRLLEAPE